MHSPPPSASHACTPAAAGAPGFGVTVGTGVGEGVGVADADADAELDALGAGCAAPNSDGSRVPIANSPMRTRTTASAAATMNRRRVLRGFRGRDGGVGPEPGPPPGPPPGAVGPGAAGVSGVVGSGP